MDQQARHELKHEITYGDYLALRRRLLPVMQHDPHVGPDGLYRVHSLYFDNHNDKILREKLDGKAEREKFRIRYYNNDLDHIQLEKKYKNYGLGVKYNAPMTADQVRALLRGDTAWMAESPYGLIRELYVKMKTETLRPRTTVDYVREPFLYSPGNVRVTFDSQIESAGADENFLEPHAAIPAARGKIVLEIKYDRYLPALVAGLLDLGNFRAAVFSKYAICRMVY